MIACISMAHASNSNNNKLQFTLICNSITGQSENLQSALPNKRVLIYDACRSARSLLVPVQKNILDYIPADHNAKI